MSKEFADSAARLQRDSQPPAPTARNGMPPAPAAAEPLAARPAPNVGQACAPLPASPALEAPVRAPWLQPDDGPLVQTELQDVNICKTCGTAVPIGVVSCPGCGQFAKHNPGARKRRKGDVEKLLRSILADYAPSTTASRESCHDLALTLAELKVVRVGSTEWQRLIQGKQTLVDELEASRSQEARTPTDIAALTTDGMIERTTTILRGLLEIRDAENASRPVIKETATPEPAPAAAPVVAQPEPPCPYCHRTCVGPDHFAYSVLHWNDPVEVEKRNEHATAVMIHQIGKPSGWDY